MSSSLPTSSKSLGLEFQSQISCFVPKTEPETSSGVYSRLQIRFFLGSCSGKRFCLCHSNPPSTKWNGGAEYFLPSVEQLFGTSAFPGNPEKIGYPKIILSGGKFVGAFGASRQMNLCENSGKSSKKFSAETILLFQPKQIAELVPRERGN